MKDTGMAPDKIRKLFLIIDEDMNSIPFLIEHNMVRFAINRGYYAVFNLINAMLISSGEFPDQLRHRQIAKLFEEKLSDEPDTIAMYKYLAQKRREADRNENSAFTVSDAMECYKSAKKLYAIIKERIRYE